MEGNSIISIGKYKQLYPNRLTPDTLRPNQAISVYNLVQDNSEKAVILTGMLSAVSNLEISGLYSVSLSYFDNNGQINEDCIREKLLVDNNAEFSRIINSIDVDTDELGKITLGCVGYFRDSFDDFLDDVFVKSEELSLV